MEASTKTTRLPNAAYKARVNRFGRITDDGAMQHVELQYNIAVLFVVYAVYAHMYRCILVTHRNHTLPLFLKERVGVGTCLDIPQVKPQGVVAVSYFCGTVHRT